VLGLPVRFASNDAAVLDVVLAAFGAWRALPARLIEARPPLQVRIVVHDGAEGAAAHAPLAFRMPDDARVFLHSPGSMGVSDPQRGEAVAYVTPQLLADAEHFRYGVVEALSWALLTRFDRQPFHAAALASADAALLLCGPSGAGKSTLAYAAARAGLRVLADDTVFVQNRPSVRVWGAPAFIHLPPDAGNRFPELAARAPTLNANGKLKLAVDLRTAGYALEVGVVQRCGLCVLRQRQPTAHYAAASPDQLLSLLDLHGQSGFDIFADTIAAPVRSLAEHGGWVLHPSADPEEAVVLLRAMLETLREG
jgi:hypothetical protein